MMTKRETRALIGRRITGVELHRFDRNRNKQEEGYPQPYGGKDRWASDPVIELDNGQRLRFVVQETDVGEYGIELVLSGTPKEEA